jgi:hypothetical protein
MVMALDPSYLAKADRHVAKLKALITDQEALIELLSAEDQPIAWNHERHPAPI